MEVRYIGLTKGTSGHRLRLAAQLSYDDRKVPPETLWFEVEESLRESLTDSGNPWLVAVLPLCMTLREPLRLRGVPVDHLLLQNAQHLMQVWKEWYPSLAVVPIEAETLAPSSSSSSKARMTAAFFSSGVDSCYTLLNHLGDSPVKIDELLIIWGFDIPLRNDQAFRRLRDKAGRVAAHFGVPLFDVATNLKETRLPATRWGPLLHGPALASVALGLERRYSRVLIASTLPPGCRLAWGSHPRTDPLLSTSRTQIIHDGDDISRVQKTERVAQSQLMLDSLRVCAVSFTEENCCACNKCYRTMITLDILGVLKRATTFSIKEVDPDSISRIYSRGELELLFLKEVRDFARLRGREEIARALELSFDHSARLGRWMRPAEFLKHMPFLWRYAPALERLLLRRSII